MYISNAEEVFIAMGIPFPGERFLNLVLNVYSNQAPVTLVEFLLKRSSLAHTEAVDLGSFDIVQSFCL